MEKGMAKRGSVRVDENMDVERPSVIQHTDKISEKSVAKDQLVVDGRLTSAEVKRASRGRSLGSKASSGEESDTDSHKNLKKRRSSLSASSTTSTSSKSVKQRRSKKKSVYSSKPKKHNPHNPYFSYDARDTETRINKPGETVDMTVGLVENGEYEVERLLMRKYDEGKFLYLVKWKGWDDEHNSWEPESNLGNSKDHLKDLNKLSYDLLPERFRDIANKVPPLVALTGKYALYERDIVLGMTLSDYAAIFNLSESEESLPSLKLLCSHIGKLEKNPDKELAAKIKKMLMIREAVRLRYEQQRELKNFIDTMNKVNGSGELLFIENEIDLTGPPINFKVIKENHPYDELTIPNDPLVGCECVTCDEKSKCCPSLAGDFTFPYNVEGKLQLQHGKPVYECNKRCACSSSCINRVVQNGSKIKLKIYKTKEMGWGVKTLEDISQGTFVCEYVGEVISRPDADERQKNREKGSSNYIFELDYNPLDGDNADEKLPYSIDAASFGNISHFINHSCDPNLGVYAVYVDCLEPHLPRLGLYAIKTIKAGDQIFFDYSAEYHKKRRQKVTNKKNSLSNKNVCKCGSIGCRSIKF